MNAYERLMAEELPTGTFGGPRPPTPRWTPIEQLEHRRTLEAALDGWEYTGDPRRLRAVPDAA